LRFLRYKDRRIMAAGLKTTYSAPTEEAALAALQEFRAAWDAKYPMIGRS
jgi:putative transposase